MGWKDIVAENNIAVIWVPKEYTKSGSFIAKCPEFPNGAIILCILLKDEEVEFVALHEIGHLVSGKALAKVNNLLKYLEHSKNEANANRFLFRNIAPRFVDENERNLQWTTPDRLCEFLGIRSTFENIQIAQEEIDLALWGEYD